MLKTIKTSLIFLVLGTLGLGLVYGAGLTAVAQVLFPERANGSLVWKGVQLVGSSLIGQEFNDERYFWGRLSATAETAYNGRASGGSNLASNNPELAARAAERIGLLTTPDQKGPIPVDLITASGSGLDPHISPEAAHFQVARVARARGLSAPSLHNLVESLVYSPLSLVAGQPVVNVLELNLGLDSLESEVH